MMKLHYMILSLAIVACTESAQSDQEGKFLDDRRWLTRLLASVWNWHAPAPDSMVEAVVNEGRSATLQLALDDPRSAEGVFRWSNQFLGTDAPQKTLAGGTLLANLEGYAAEVSSTVSAAQAFSRKSEFWAELFNLTPPIYAPRLQFESYEYEFDGLRTRYDPVAARINFKAALTAKLESLLEMGPEMIAGELCSTFKFVEQSFYDNGLRFRLTEELFEIPTLAAVRQFCAATARSQEINESQSLAATFARDILAMLQELERFEAPSYSPMKVLDLRPLDPIALGLSADQRSQLAWLWFWDKLPNSRTNLNRRRAAYILKHFLCDEQASLPTGLISMRDGGTLDPHLQNSNCQTCHYRLDPLAGFFRANGKRGRAPNGDKITFDDDTSEQFLEFAKHWQGADGANRIDLVHSLAATPKHQIEQDGLDFGGLLEKLRTSPEVAKCFVKLSYSYFFGQPMFVAPPVLAEESAKFLAAVAEKTTSAALRDLAARIAMSGSYNRIDIPQTTCGDLKPTPDQKICLLFSELNRHCGSCHQDNVSAGSLSFENWLTNADGGFRFKHLRDGEPVKARESVEAILDRVNAGAEPDRRMPPDGLSPQEVANLTKLLKEALNP